MNGDQLRRRKRFHHVNTVVLPPVTGSPVDSYLKASTSIDGQPAITSHETYRDWSVERTVCNTDIESIFVPADINDPKASEDDPNRWAFGTMVAQYLAAQPEPVRGFIRIPENARVVMDVQSHATLPGSESALFCPTGLLDTDMGTWCG